MSENAVRFLDLGGAVLTKRNAFRILVHFLKKNLKTVFDYPSLGGKRLTKDKSGD